MRAGIYLRISQDRSGEELGVSRQREDCEGLAARRGWDVHRVYVDNDTSAKGHKVRPEWEAMMADVEAGRLDVVIGWTVDRTLRSGRDRLRMLESGKEHGITIALARGSDMDLSTPSGRLAADILGAVALNEIEVKSDRQKSAHRQAAAQGRRMGGRRPFGYEQDGVTVREAEAAAVRAAFQDYLRGTPILAIARRWNEAGLLSGVVNPQTGEPTKWDHSGVRFVLKNARYAGFRVHNGEVAGPAQWPALVDEITFRRVGALLDSAASEFKPRGGRRLLTGVAVCGVCGTSIHVGGNKAGSAPVYRCPSGKHVTRRAAPVEDQVQRTVVAFLNSEQAKSLLVEDDGNDQVALDAEATDLRTEMETIALERAQRKITRQQFDLMNTEYQAQLHAVQARMSRSTGSPLLTELITCGVTLAQWLDIDLDQRRNLIAALVDIRLYSGGRGVRNPPPETVQVTPKGRLSTH